MDHHRRIELLPLDFFLQWATDFINFKTNILNCVFSLTKSGLGSAQYSICK